jgi:hypothetical protein
MKYLLLEHGSLILPVLHTPDGRNARFVPFNTSTCIDAKTIPFVSKYLRKTRFFLVGGSGVRLLAAGYRVAWFNVQRFDI